MDSNKLLKIKDGEWINPAEIKWVSRLGVATFVICFIGDDKPREYESDSLASWLNELPAEIPPGDEIASLNLSNRVHRILRKGGIMTVQQLRNKDDFELFRLANFGKGALAEVKQRLSLISPPNA